MKKSVIAFFVFWFAVLLCGKFLGVWMQEKIQILFPFSHFCRNYSVWEFNFVRSIKKRSEDDKRGKDDDK